MNPDEARAEAHKLANDILAGNTQPYGSSGHWPAKDWKAAAQYLVDTDDCDEMLYMMAIEAQHERAAEWTQADYNNDDTYAGEWR